MTTNSAKKNENDKLKQISMDLSQDIYALKYYDKKTEIPVTDSVKQ